MDEEVSKAARQERWHIAKRNNFSAVLSVLEYDWVAASRDIRLRCSPALSRAKMFLRER